jgi:Ni,Fe-hydrogenase maturation factor
VVAALGAGSAVDGVDTVDRVDLAVLDPVQLTPELAVDIGRAAVVVFVDASVDEAGVVRCVPVAPAAGSPGAFTHSATPAGLLALVRDLSGAAPPAWLVSVGAATFAPGTGLSPAVAAVVPDAVACVARLVADAARGRPAVETAPQGRCGASMSACADWGRSEQPRRRVLWPEALEARFQPPALPHAPPPIPRTPPERSRACTSTRPSRS